MVRQVSGRTSYNYGIVGASFPFQPDEVIDHYLATNRRPRAIIVYLSPWSVIDPGVIHDRVWYPTGLQVLQHGDLRDVMRLLRAHPLAPVEVPQIVARTFQPLGGGQAGRIAALRAAMEAANGVLDYTSILPAQRRTLVCPPDPPRRAARPLTLAARASHAAVARMRARYAAQAIPLYFYVAPVAQCHAPVAAIQRAYGGLADNVPIALPSELFARDTAINQATHVNSDGQRVVSRLLGEFIVAHGIGGAR